MTEKPNADGVSIPSSVENNADETVERYDTGASVSVDISRGTGTRDQEKWTFKGKGRDSKEALEELETQLDAFEQHFAERVRNIQPEVDDGGN